VATNESLKNLLENFIFLPMRLRVCARSHSKYRARTQAITTTRHVLEQCTKYGIEYHRVVFNVALYLLLLDQDLADLTDSMVNATGDRKRAFIAKYEAMLLYEASEDTTQLIGREFRDAIKALGTSEDQLGRLNDVSSNLNKFWQTNRDFLGTIRKALAAHRDQNSLHYLESLEKLKPLDVMNCAVGLSEHIEQLVKLITNVTLSSSNLGSMLRDMLESGKRRGH
jgi:hypothetical protein